MELKRKKPSYRSKGPDESDSAVEKWISLHKYEALEKENTDLRKELERERLRLAACGVAAMQNTEESKNGRIKPDNEYYSASYGDVCDAVDREIALRERLEQLVDEAEKAYKAMDTCDTWYNDRVLEELERAIDAAKEVK